MENRRERTILMNATCCPDRHVLEAYLLGNVDDAALDAHLDDCVACQAMLDQIDAAVNRPFAILREPVPSATFLQQPGYSTLVAHAKELATAPLNGHATLHGDSLETQTLGSYLLLEPIGEDGMGRVYKAVHQRLKKTVAVKLLAPSLVRSAEIRQRFQREMEAVGRLSSPHIVSAHDAGEADGRDFLVMEYVEGKNLTQIVNERGPLPIEQALDYVLQAARGLAHAHAAGIIHRDVKPSNLLLDTNGVVKVLDLGLARFRLDDMSPLAPGGRGGGGEGDATANIIMGTAAFMAPEQALDTHRADEAADIYSLGCTLYFLLTGKSPYEGKTSMEMLVAHREQPIPRLPETPGVDRLLGWMLAKKPQDRPASMETVMHELERLRAPSPAFLARRQFDWRVAIAASIFFTLVGMGSLALMNPLGDPGEPRKDPPAPLVKLPKKDATPIIDMALIPSGKFFMGASDTDRHASASEKPRREIKINRPFFLGKTEITQAQYEEVMGNNPAAFSKKGAFKDRIKDLDTSKHPVESVSWLDAVRFCNRLSERHELEPYYKIADKDVVTIKGGTGYRLPTEAEWEYACRGNSTTTWHFGENQADLKEHA